MLWVAFAGKTKVERIVVGGRKHHFNVMRTRRASSRVCVRVGAVPPPVSVVMPDESAYNRTGR